MPPRKYGLASVADVAKDLGQNPQAVLRFLRSLGIPHHEIGDEVFFNEAAFRRAFESGAEPSLSPDGVDAVCAQLEQLGFKIMERRGTRASIVVAQVRAEHPVTLVLLGDPAEPECGLTPLAPRIVRVYVAHNLLRGVAHFSVSFSRFAPAEASSDHDLFVFRSTKLQQSFVRTRSELYIAYRALTADKKEKRLGMSLQGKNLHLTFSPARADLFLEHRLISRAVARADSTNGG